MEELHTGKEAAHSAYDVVVIGGGMGGLTSGALLARAGKKVLVVEEQQVPGGHAHAIRKDGYTFDSALHLITSCRPEDRFGVGTIDALLRHLGIRDRCELMPVGEPFYTVHLPDFALAVPTGRDAFLDAHLRHFPREERGLRRLMDLSAQIAGEIRAFPAEPGFADLLRMPWRFPALFRHRSSTMQEGIDRELQDPKLKQIYSTLWSWLGSPPWRASFLAWADMMGHYIEGGAYYCRGGFQTLADAVAAALVRDGGELVLGSRVTRILTAGRRVQGVELASGQRVHAPVVISNIDPRVTFRDLLENGQAAARLHRLERMELSLSTLVAYVATDLDVRSLGVGHENIYFNRWDTGPQDYADALAGHVNGISLTIPSLTDPSLAPHGQHVVILMCIAPTDPSNDATAAQGMLSLAERLIPGLGNRLTAVVGVNERSPQQLPTRRIEAIYGPATTPAQLGGRRPPHETPVHGLLLVGQWTQPGPGIPRVIESGIQVARQVLGLKSVEYVLAPPLSSAFAR